MDTFNDSKLSSIKNCIKHLYTPSSSHYEQLLTSDARRYLQRLEKLLEEQRATPEDRQVNKEKFITTLAASGVPLEDAVEIWEKL